MAKCMTIMLRAASRAGSVALWRDSAAQKLRDRRNFHRWQELPPELLALAARRCDYRALAALQQTCRAWRDVVVGHSLLHGCSCTAALARLLPARLGYPGRVAAEARLLFPRVLPRVAKRGAGHRGGCRARRLVGRASAPSATDPHLPALRLCPHGRARGVRASQRAAEDRSVVDGPLHPTLFGGSRFRVPLAWHELRANWKSEAAIPPKERFHLAVHTSRMRRASFARSTSFAMSQNQMTSCLHHAWEQAGRWPISTARGSCSSPPFDTDDDAIHAELALQMSDQSPSEIALQFEVYYPESHNDLMTREQQLLSYLEHELTYGTTPCACRRRRR